jgi:hypothetical protein
VGLTNLGSESETCVGSRVHLVGVSISFEKNFIGSHSLPPLWFVVSVLQKLNKGFLKAQAKFRENNGSVTSVNGNSNIKHKICYTCRQKGHLGKDCPNSKNPKLNHVHHSNEKLRSNSNDSSAPKVVISQRAQRPFGYLSP